MAWTLRSKRTPSKGARKIDKIENCSVSMWGNYRGRSVGLHSLHIDKRDHAHLYTQTHTIPFQLTLPCFSFLHLLLTFPTLCCSGYVEKGGARLISDRYETGSWAEVGRVLKDPWRKQKKSVSNSNRPQTIHKRRIWRIWDLNCDRNLGNTHLQVYDLPPVTRLSCTPYQECLVWSGHFILTLNPLKRSLV